MRLAHLVTVVAVAACTRAPEPLPPLPSGAERYHETTNPTIAGMHVGIGNIFYRKLPGPNGEPAKDRPSAVLAIYDPKAQKELGDIVVVVGSIVTIGGERFEVIDIFTGTSAPGWITLRRLP